MASPRHFDAARRCFRPTSENRKTPLNYPIAQTTPRVQEIPAIADWQVSEKKISVLWYEGALSIA